MKLLIGEPYFTNSYKDLDNLLSGFSFAYVNEGKFLTDEAFEFGEWNYTTNIGIMNLWDIEDIYIRVPKGKPRQLVQCKLFREELDQDISGAGAVIAQHYNKLVEWAKNVR